MAYLSEIWRYPVKSHGRESVSEVKVTAGAALPHDRLWAVIHENSTADGSKWVACHNFSRGAKAPSLMAIATHFDEKKNTLTMSHPNKEEITFCPDTEGEKLIQWTKDLIPGDRSGSAKLIRARSAAMTDTDYPSITICSSTSHQALASEMGLDLSKNRWRGNLWIDDLDPWTEMDWIGKIVQIGTVQFDIVEPVQRCMATTANPETGIRDADTLGALQAHGHQNFSVYAVARNNGNLRLGDKLTVID